VGSSPFSLRRLRARAEKQYPPSYGWDEPMLALVEAVERARHLAIPWVVDAADAGDQTAEADLRHLRRVFDRFDFDGTAE